MLQHLSYDNNYKPLDQHTLSSWSQLLDEPILPCPPEVIILMEWNGYMVNFENGDLEIESEDGLEISVHGNIKDFSVDALVQSFYRQITPPGGDAA